MFSSIFYNAQGWRNNTIENEDFAFILVLNYQQRECRELRDHVKDTKEQTERKLCEAKQAAGIGPNDDLEQKLIEVRCMLSIPHVC